MTKVAAAPDASLKTFVLGVGAQKAGTTWLHEYLNGRSDADFGFCKEYHIHDARTIASLDCFAPYVTGSLAKRSLRKLKLLAKPRTLRRLGFYLEPDRYYSYFQRLLERPGIAISGDITPSYGLLSAETLGEIRTQVEGRGMRLRTIFLMRDPIERIISSVRMNLRKKNTLTPEHEREALRRTVARRPRGMNARSDYRRTLETLDQAFAPEQIHIGFYESLFQPESIQALCTYLDIPYREPDFERRFNVSATETTFPEELMLALGAWQAETWQYCRNRFNTMDLDSLWPTTSRWCQAALDAR